MLICFSMTEDSVRGAIAFSEEVTDESQGINDHRQ